MPWRDYCLVGETGCGKTVASKALTKLIQAPGRIEKGKIIYYPEPGNPVDIISVSEDEIRKIRGKEIAYIFQDPSAALDPLYTIGHHIAETMTAHRLVKSMKEGFREAIKYLKRALMPEPEEKVKSYPHELSGGMKQRGVIATSLSTKPKVIVADEPTTAVDVTIQAQIMKLLRDPKSEEGLTLTLITHNMGLVAEMCDRVAIMYAGRIIEEGLVFDIFKNPRHPYTRALLNAVINPLFKVSKLESIFKTVPDLIRSPRGCRFHPRCPFFSEVCYNRPPNFIIGKNHKVACWLYRDNALGVED